jgi:hypothetical protein
MLIFRRLAAVLAAAVVAGTSGCAVNVDRKPERFFNVVNETSEPIVVFVEGLSPSDSYSRKDVAPGRIENYYVEGCRDNQVVATDGSGREIARLTSGYCAGETWIFNAGGTVTLMNQTSPGASTLVPSPVPPSQRPMYSGWRTATPASS